MRNARNTNIVGEGKKRREKAKRARINIMCYWVTWKSTRVSSDTVYNRRFWRKNREKFVDNENARRVIDLDRIIHKVDRRFSPIVEFSNFYSSRRPSRNGGRINVDSNKSIISLALAELNRDRSCNVLQLLRVKGVSVFSASDNPARISPERILNINHIDFWI